MRNLNRVHVLLIGSLLITVAHPSFHHITYRNMRKTKSEHPTQVRYYYMGL